MRTIRMIQKLSNSLQNTKIIISAKLKIHKIHELNASNLESFKITIHKSAFRNFL